MGRRKAIVVGIDKYGGRWQALDCCSNDALTVAEVLEGEPYGFEVSLLCDSDATATGIMSAIMRARADNPELLLFYFAGHGADTILGSYLVSFDNQDFGEGIELPKLVALLSGGPEDHWSTVVFLDCCHSGAAYLGQKESSGAAVSSLTEGAVTAAFIGLAESRAVLAACGATELVQESRTLGHGLFTFYLLEGLRGAAADHEGHISIFSLHLYLRRPFAEQMGGQEPVFRGDIRGSLVLASGLRPRLAPPLPEEEAERIDAEARDSLDRYSRLVNSFTPDAWRTHGFEEAYRALTPIAKWFESQLEKNPELAQRVRFAQSYDAMISRRQALGTIEPGLRFEEGSVVHPSLGSGGYGEVWQLKSDDGRSFAFKLYHPHELRDLEKAERFRTGFEAMRMLKHERIVKVTRFSECPLGFVMEMIDGQNLRDLQPSKTLDGPLELVRLLVEIADTIEHAHQNEVIHRDIKPENIIARLDESAQWRPFLTDFDLAWYSTANQRNTRSALGVVYYAAPEQHINYDPRASFGRRPTLDVFSFGQLIYFVFTNADPDPVKLGENSRRLSAACHDWGSNDAVSTLVNLYEACTEWNPSDRIQSFDAIQSGLRNISTLLSHSATDKVLDASSFMQEVRYQYGGQISTVNAVDSVEFVSVSGQWRAVMRFSEHGSGSRLKSSLEVRFTPHGAMPALTGVSNDRMRSKVNMRVDNVLTSNDGAKRKSGRQGAYEVYIEFATVELSLAGAAKVRDVIVRVIGALERS